jgi:hypothetical protein
LKDSTRQPDSPANQAPAGRSVYVALAAIALVALAVRLAWIAYADYQPTLSDDAGRYDFLGRSLAEGGGYVNPNGNTTMFWPPGYPFLLAAVYKLWPASALGDHEVTAALIVNAVAAAATSVLIFALARRLAPWSAGTPARDTAGLAAAGLYALLPSAVFYAGVTLSETWFTFLLMLSLWMLAVGEERRSWWWRLATGVVIGYAALVRGQALLLPFVAVAFWVARARSDSKGRSASTGQAANSRAQTTNIKGVVATLAVVGGVTVGVVLPWTVRNFVESGRLVAISSNAGVDFYIGHSAAAEGRGRIVDELVFRYPELPPAEAEARVSQDGFREGLEYAVRNPARELVLSAKKVWFLYAGDHEAVAWTDAHGERRVMPGRLRDALAVVSDVYYTAVMLLAAAGVAFWVRWRGWRTDGGPGVLLLSVVGYWTLVAVAFFGDPRFHAPIMGVVSVWAAYGIVPMLRREAR